MPWLPHTALLLLLLHCFSSLAKAQPDATKLIGQGSVITAGSGSAWTSPSNRFAFGFYQTENDFAVGIWLVATSTVIWTADRDGILHPKGTSLSLTNDGLQIQSHTGDRPICNITVEEAKLLSASMEDNGNFVILDVNNQVMWQTFDYPTDTLMAGQVLRAGHNLVSSVSSVSHASGRFQVMMQQGGNLAFYPVNTPDNGVHAYWTTETYGDGYTSVRLTDGGYLLLNRDVNATHNTTVDLKFTKYGRIEPDGFFRTYIINGSIPQLLFIYPDTADECFIKGACGSNSYCNYTYSSNSSSRSIGGKKVCLCLPGFVYNDQSKPYLGCQRNFSMEQCVAAAKSNNITYSVIKLVNISWSDDPYNYTDSSTEKDCSDSCLRDCSCYAALFSGQRCSKQRNPFLYGTQSSSKPIVAFLKIGSGDPKLPPPSLPMEVIQYIPNTKILLLIVALACIVIVTFSVAFFYLYINLSYKNRWERMETGMAGGMAPRSFTYRQVVEATENFSVCLGSGSFSAVYKGKIQIENSKSVPIAVKKLNKEAAVNQKGFQTEMKAAGGAHHRNLVRLLGFCQEGTEWLLIYEYMSRGSLDKLIFPPPEEKIATVPPELQPPQAAQEVQPAQTAYGVQAPQAALPSWKERTRIAMDVARGILYLHEGCDTTIIHGDVKPENILVAEDGTAKIGDLGLAKLLRPGQLTYTNARGTCGYIAPEWGKGDDPVNEGVDVYSFGLLLLVLITCQKDFRWLLREKAYDCLKKSTLEQLLPNGEEVDKEELKKLVTVALWCMQKPPHRKTMKEVVRMLGGKMTVTECPDHFSHICDTEAKVSARTGPDAGREGGGGHAGADSEQQKVRGYRKGVKEAAAAMRRGNRHASTSR